ncbi:hypothetical protein CBL_11999 [Carabus blaptoides fortunei]
MDCGQPEARVTRLYIAPYCVTPKLICRAVQVSVYNDCRRENIVIQAASNLHVTNERRSVAWPWNVWSVGHPCPMRDGRRDVTCRAHAHTTTRYTTPTCNSSPGSEWQQNSQPRTYWGCS